MRVIVINKGINKPSKWNYGLNRRVTCEDIDNPGEYYYLNLTEEHNITKKWDPAIVEGNVLDVQIIAGTKNINKFGQFSIVREVNV